MACTTSGCDDDPPGPSCDDPVVDTESPPKNPFLADSIYAIPHGDAAQQDSTQRSGPEGPTKTLSEAERNYQQIGPGHFGIYISSPYPDGRRVVWSNGADRIAKLDHASFEVLDEYPVKPMDQWPTDEQIDDAIDTLDSHDCSEGIDSPDCKALQAEAFRLASLYLRGIDGVYAMLDKDNTLYVGGSQQVVAYGDVEAGNPDSEIEIKRTWDIPTDGSVPGNLVGFNMTFDGWIIMVTDLGALVAMSRDFQEIRTVMLNFSEQAPAHNAWVDSLGLRGQYWVRNPMAIDDDGSIYVASADHMHRVMWIEEDEEFSRDQADGAWTVPYSNVRDEEAGRGGLGTGATPSLIGFGEDEDKFVVITDGDALMNMTYFWREDIPEGWEKLPNALSDRVAGKLPANFGNDELEFAQSEQSVVVSGYGAVVVNNEARNVPADTIPQAVRLYASFLGAEPLFQPFGMQKFEWDPEAKKLEEAWANPNLSSPNSVPYISRDSDLVYTVGARDGLWTLEGVDFCSGESSFHYVVGGARHNSLFSGVHLDEEGRIIYGNPFGKLRLDIN
jgi:hypothetical protein